MTAYVPYSRRNSPDLEPGPREEFRRQAFRNIDRAIGQRRKIGQTFAGLGDDHVSPSFIWSEIVDRVEHEFGIDLSRYGRGTARGTFEAWFLDSDTPMSSFLTGLEFAVRIVSRAQPIIFSHDYLYENSVELEAPQLIADTNARFRQWDISYQIDSESCLVVKDDSEYVHSEVVSPALKLIREAGFAGAESEFASALEHHRHGREVSAMNDALRAFESTMKQICDERDWEYDKNRDGAAQLIDVIIRKNGLLPTWMTEQFTQLRGLLSSGTPTPRNKLSGHGAGRIPAEVPGFFAAYAIHTAAANILLLVQAHRNQ